MDRFPVRRVSILLVLGITALGWAGVLAKSPESSYQTEDRRTFPARAATLVDLENIAGKVVIEGTASGEIEIVGTIHSEAESDREARELARMLDITFESSGDRIVVRANYPIDDHRTYHYPPSEPENKILRNIGTRRTTTHYHGKKITITSKAGGDALTLYADFRLRLPHGVGVKVLNLVGTIEAEGVKGPVTTESSSGDFTASNGSGDIHTESGSGDIAVRDQKGDIHSETGSGDVELTRVAGAVHTETGSGDVTMSDVEGERIESTTGSGDIRLTDVAGSISASTGSGDIDGSDLRLGSQLVAETGSGDVSLSGSMADLEKVDISTGSGDVVLAMSAPPSVRLSISTGSGDIEVDLPVAKLIRNRRNSYEAVLGKGEGEASIGTGSGDVHVRGD